MQSGRAFEQEVKHRIEEYINEGQLGINPQLARVFFRKGYFSRVREKPIIMDVSIELYRRGATDPYLVWIWECKDYKGRVPVDDVEEFHTKLEQIGLHKTKGTIVCRNGFQESAVRVAQAYGIGLVRILPEGRIIYLAEAETGDIISEDFIVFGLTQPGIDQLTTLVYGLSSSGKGITSMEDLILLEIPQISKSDQEGYYMPCTPGTVEFNDNGKEIYFKETECPLVKFWKAKYGAKAKREWILESGTSLLYDLDVEYISSMVSGSGLEQGNVVWAISHSIAQAYHDASLILQFVLAATAKEHEEIYHSLLKAGYPDEALGVVTVPE